MRESDAYKSFNSLQTGKCIQSKEDNAECIDLLCMFQFPSNGKVYSEIESKAFVV